MYHSPIITLQLRHYAGEPILPENILIQLQNEEQTEIIVTNSAYAAINFGTRGTDNQPFGTRARVNSSTFVMQGNLNASDIINSVESFRIKSLTAEGKTYTEFIYS